MPWYCCPYKHCHSSFIVNTLSIDIDFNNNIHLFASYKKNSYFCKIFCMYEHMHIPKLNIKNSYHEKKNY